MHKGARRAARDEEIVPSPPDGVGRAPIPDAVTSVIRHRLKPGDEARYEAWLREITPVAQRFPGHLGVDVIRPPVGSGAYTVILRFDTLEHLQDWLGSETRRRLVEKVEPLLVEGDRVEIETGLEFWFTPPAGRPYPRPYKQFLVTFSAIFPLTLLVPWALGPLFRSVPVLGLPIPSHFLVAAIIVGLMTYVIMPRYTRLIAGWLYR